MIRVNGDITLKVSKVCFDMRIELANERSIERRPSDDQGLARSVCWRPTIYESR